MLLSSCAFEPRTDATTSPSTPGRPNPIYPGRSTGMQRCGAAHVKVPQGKKTYRKCCRTCASTSATSRPLQARSTLRRMSTTAASWPSSAPLRRARYAPCNQMQFSWGVKGLAAGEVQHFAQDVGERHIRAQLRPNQARQIFRPATQLSVGRLGGSRETLFTPDVSHRHIGPQLRPAQARQVCALQSRSYHVMQECQLSRPACRLDNAPSHHSMVTICFTLEGSNSSA